MNNKYIILMILVALVGSGSIWLIDVSNIMLTDGDRNLFNGFVEANPNKAFHVGMYLALGSIWLLVILHIARR